MALTMEQVVAQLQQELFTLKAQVAAESGLADAVRAINNLAECPVSEGYSEPHRRKGPRSSERILWQRGRLSAVVQEDGGLLRGSKESEMMFEWASEQGVEITRDAVDLEFLPTRTWSAVCRTWSLCCSRCILR